MAYIQRMRCRIAVACVAAAAAAASHPSMAGAAPSTGSLTVGSVSNAAGTLSYKLYVPASYQPGAPMPLVVALHGCTQSADVFQNLTRFDDLAAARGFIVVFPEQNSKSNSFRCWNWFLPTQMQRDAGEPSLIAGVTNEVRRNYNIDPQRIYVTGLSAGGAMADVMGATYPDLYAAIGVGSGCEYAGTAACAGYRGQDPTASGRQAYQAMGPRARVMPFIVFQGDQDTTVPPANAEQVVRSEQVADDLADDGAQNGSIPTAPAKTKFGQVPGGRSFTTRYYSDGKGHELGQFWLVQGMVHAWSGGNPAEQFSDPAGPDETAAMYDFFMAHPGPGAPPPPPAPAPAGPASTPPAPGQPRAAEPSPRKAAHGRARTHKKTSHKKKSRSKKTNQKKKKSRKKTSHKKTSHKKTSRRRSTSPGRR